MNKIKRIAILFLIISTIFNFIYSVKALSSSVGINNIEIKKTRFEIMQLKQKVDKLKNNKDNLGDYSQSIVKISEDVDNYLKAAEEDKNGTTMVPSQNWNFITSVVNALESRQNTESSYNSSNNVNQTTVDYGDTYYIPKNLKKVPGYLYKVEAKINEFKKTVGGKAGDQTGNEVRIMPFPGDKRIFSVFRHSDPKVARTIAYYLGDAASNEYIGYDQPDRDSFDIEVAKVNYEPMNLTTPCNTDCSAFVSTGIKFAFMKAGINKKVSLMDTPGLRRDLPGLGFTEVTDIGRGTSDQLASTQKMQIGDIAVTISKGHAFVCMGDYYIASETPPLSPGVYGSGGSNGYTAEGEEVDDRQNIDEKKFRFSGLPGDVTYEGEINPIRNFFKKIGDFIDYLLGLLFMIIKVIIIGFTNIIYNIFLTITSFMKK